MQADVWDTLEIIAHQDGRTTANLINMILQRYVKGEFKCIAKHPLEFKGDMKTYLSRVRTAVDQIDEDEPWP